MLILSVKFTKVLGISKKVEYLELLLLSTLCKILLLKLFLEEFGRSGLGTVLLLGDLVKILELTEKICLMWLNEIPRRQSLMTVKRYLLMWG